MVLNKPMFNRTYDRIFLQHIQTTILTTIKTAMSYKKLPIIVHGNGIQQTKTANVTKHLYYSNHWRIIGQEMSLMKVFSFYRKVILIA